MTIYREKSIIIILIADSFKLTVAINNASCDTFKTSDF